MGLDMYLEGRKGLIQDYKNPDNDQTEDGFRKIAHTLELGYWRKHPDLHGFIVQTFAGGNDDCQQIWLCRKDLVAIIDAVKEGRLPSTTGFFFGASPRKDDGDEYRRSVENDVAILEGAIRWLDGPYDSSKEHRLVFYQASW